MGEGKALTGAGGRAHAGEPAAAGGPEAIGREAPILGDVFAPHRGAFDDRLLIAYLCQERLRSRPLWTTHPSTPQGRGRPFGCVGCPQLDADALPGTSLRLAPLRLPPKPIFNIPLLGGCGGQPCGLPTLRNSQNRRRGGFRSCGPNAHPNS